MNYERKISQETYDFYAKLMNTLRDSKLSGDIIVQSLCMTVASIAVRLDDNYPENDNIKNMLGLITSFINQLQEKDNFKGDEE